MNYTLKKEAIKLLSRFLISCSHPLMQSTPEGKKHEKHACFWAKKNVDISLSDFLAGLGHKPELYLNLIQAADKLGKKSIDSEVIFNYFGGAMHIDKVWNDLINQDQESIPPVAKGQFIFFHQCLPIIVRSITKVVTDKPEEERIMISGEYSAAEKKVFIGNMAVFREDTEKIFKSREIVAHFGTVILPELNPDLKAFFLETQSDQRFLDALDIIDGRKISNVTMSKKAAATMESYGL